MTTLKSLLQEKTAKRDAKRFVKAFGQEKFDKLCQHYLNRSIKEGVEVLSECVENIAYALYCDPTFAAIG